MSEQEKLKEFAEHIGELIHDQGYCMAMAIQGTSGCVVHVCSGVYQETMRELTTEYINSTQGN